MPNNQIGVALVGAFALASATAFGVAYSGPKVRTLSFALGIIFGAVAVVSFLFVVKPKNRLRVVEDDEWVDGPGSTGRYSLKFYVKNHGRAGFFSVRVRGQVEGVEERTDGFALPWADGLVEQRIAKGHPETVNLALVSLADRTVTFRNPYHDEGDTLHAIVGRKVIAEVELSGIAHRGLRFVRAIVDLDGGEPRLTLENR